MNAKYIFDAARDFRTGSNILANQFGKEVFPIRSTVINAAFSIELYLKCLLLLTVGRVPKSHKLIDLYEALPKDTQDLAQSKYRDILGGSDELRDALLEHNSVFVEWRYIFEKQGSSFSLSYQSLQAAATALDETTISVQPEWQTGE